MFQKSLGTPISKLGSLDSPNSYSSDISNSKARMRSGIFQKLKTTTDFETLEKKIKKKTDEKKKSLKTQKNDNIIIRKTEEFERFYIENLLKKNTKITQISCLMMATDCFIRATSSIFEMKISGGLVYMRVGDFILSSIFVLNFYLIKYGSKASTIKNLIYFGFILRLLSLLFEYQVVMSMNFQHR